MTVILDNELFIKNLLCFLLDQQSNFENWKKLLVKCLI